MLEAKTIREIQAEIANIIDEKGLNQLKIMNCIAGWDKQATSLELHRANEVACKPPLRKDEVNTIIRSVYKYEN